MGEKSIAVVIYNLNEFGLKLTEDTKSLPDSNLRTRSPASIQKQELLFKRIREAHKLYTEKGTLEAAGRVLGVTRERVRQMLAKGSNLGLFEYKPHDYPFVPKDKILDDYRKFLNLNDVANANNITTGYLHKLLTAYNITEKDLGAARIECRKLDCINRYNHIKNELVRHPTTTELQRTKKWRYLSLKITKLWGSFDAFRQELNIPKPPQGSPSFSEDTREWREHKQRLALVIRMERLDNIRECLSVSGPMALTAIANKCGLADQTAWNLMHLLIATGEVIREGSGAHTKYRLIS